MTRSIFDPSNPDVEQSGTRNVVSSAAANSKMPADVIDGQVNEDEADDDENAIDTRSAAERLEDSVPPVGNDASSDVPNGDRPAGDRDG